MATCNPPCLNEGFCVALNDCLCPSTWGGPQCQYKNVLGIPSIYVILGFFVITVTSFTLGKFITYLRMPVITGYLLIGIVAGPIALNLIPGSALRDLAFVDSISLAFITFAAGHKLILADLQGMKKAIGTVSFLIFVFEYGCGTFITYGIATSGLIKFTAVMTTAQRLGVSVLISSIMCARSPSALIAVVDEMKASGPFTAFVLGITTTTDLLAILFFSISLLIATSVFSHPASTVFGYTVAQVLISFVVGLVLSKILPYILFAWQSRIQQHTKRRKQIVDGVMAILFILVCYTFYVIETYAKDLVDTMIVFMTTGFVISNFSKWNGHAQVLQDVVGKWIYLIFFTFIGASLHLQEFGQAVILSIFLFLVRAFFIFMSTYIGQTAFPASKPYRHLTWMACLTQVGVSLGLAKKVVGAFPEWGGSFATVIFATVVLNQIVGPPLTKCAISRVGESGKRVKIRGKALLICDAEDSTKINQASDLINRLDWEPHVLTVKSLMEGHGENWTEAVRDHFTRTEDREATDRLPVLPNTVLVDVADDSTVLTLANAIAHEYPKIRLVVYLSAESTAMKGATGVPEGEPVYLPPSAIIIREGVAAVQMVGECLLKRSGPELATVNLRPLSVQEQAKKARAAAARAAAQAQRDAGVDNQNGPAPIELNDVPRPEFDDQAPQRKSRDVSGGDINANTNPVIAQSHSQNLSREVDRAELEGPGNQLSRDDYNDGTRRDSDNQGYVQRGGGASGFQKFDDEE